MKVYWQLASAIALVSTLVLGACAPAPAAPTAAPKAAESKPAAAPPATDARTYRVGITQIVSHPVLDAIREGFVDQLKQNGFEEGKNVVYDVQIAQNDQTLAKTIADKFVNDRVDTVVAISTPSLQSTAQATKGTNIPVIFVAVSDPVAAGVVTSVDQPSGSNVTGVYNFDPVEAQADVAGELKDGLKRLGAIYNAGEANSVANITKLKDEAQRRGWEVVEATVASTADVRTAAQSLVGRVDAVYMPTDNTVAAALEALVRVTQEAKLPLIAGDVDSVRRGALAAVGDDPDDKGRQAADIAAKVLRGENPGAIPLERVRTRKLFLNETTADLVGIRLSDELRRQAAEIFK